ncbi:BlaI/MecI/CopY family transcriptional regulator [Aureispira sp. CCB-E]|uniref:BlaI/MecI/CopY family transcriptional regulator n=1 Tax=Aureispira sp. CCB-E TaxID=3051121 RepID=UPI002868EEB8|nr:BlaI/MecI/CopY family transcriptional regulator [Aureispira sp. CCB-E]WMX15575.1 BlaI/MecI/CopY family transcriptional regulator [Aureispira sp. CCB-E]
MKLSKTEEELMQHIWRLENVFMKDILEAYEEPKPATTTIATLLKRIRDKGFIDYKTFGKSRKYYPLVSKSDYFGKHFRGLLQNFFGNSASRFASFFTQSTDLTKDELEALRAVIDEEIKKKDE